MLQALKNLEARSPARPAAKPVATPAKAVIERVAEPVASTAAASSPLPPVTESIDALAGQLASLEVPVNNSPGRFDWSAFSPSPISTLPPPAPALETVARQPLPASACRVACEIERRVRRTLSDPVQSKPLVELASRLRQDMQQTAAKTVALVGVGPSGAHEALLYAATVLAERANEHILLVDADFSRRTLSEALEFGRERGLGEVLENQAAIEDLCRPTAVERLSFLPAGLSQQLDYSGAGARLSTTLEKLASGFPCVLVDVGRTVDPAASTLARIADAAYLVVQLGTVEASEAQKALADFRAAGVRVLGCIAT